MPHSNSTARGTRGTKRKTADESDEPYLRDAPLASRRCIEKRLRVVARVPRPRDRWAVRCVVATFSFRAGSSDRPAGIITLSERADDK